MVATLTESEIFEAARELVYQGTTAERVRTLRKAVEAFYAWNVAEVPGQLSDFANTGER